MSESKKRQFAPKVGETRSPAADDSGRRFSFEFRGRAGEYFRIWIVNVLLTIVTLGIYSPWAKVRTKRYFYGNAFVADANFEYHARPFSILLARVVVLLLTVGGGAIAAGYGAAVDARYSFLLFLFLPWALVRGISFNARNSSYRGLRFSFVRRYGEAYFALFALPAFLLAALFSLFWFDVLAEGSFESVNVDAKIVLENVGIDAAVILIALLPYFVFRYHRFKVANHALGRTRFVFAQSSIPYYFALVATLLLLTAVVVFAVRLLLRAAEKSESFVDGVTNGSFNVIHVIGLLVLFFYVFFVPRAMLFKAFWAGVQTENGARIECDISIIDFAGYISIVNFLASLLSFGLLHPWAKVRKARYIASHLHLVAPLAAIDSLRLGETEKTGAFGEELDAAEGFDFDVGLI